MTLLDRRRVTNLLELTAMERIVTGPERMLRGQDVALLITAAYDDASDTARAAFMARVQKMPTSAWPWSAVQAAALPPDMGPRGGGGLANLGVPQPVVPTTPALLILVRGEAASADADPGNKLPDRDTPEGAPWEALQIALDRWDTAVIRQHIGTQGWVLPGTDGGATNGAPAPEGGAGPGTQGVQATQGVPATQIPMWKQPAVLAVGATALVVTSVSVYALTRGSTSKRLEAELERQAQEAMKR